MTNSSVPLHVQSLITSHIQTLEHLEVLMLLFRHADRWWSAQHVSEELHMSPVASGTRLEDLSSRMLLDARLGEAVVFRYSPLTDALRWGVDDLAHLYSERPLQVITLVSALTADPIRGSGDPLRIRPRKSDG